ncbi:MAG: serine hydrolase domain-containing protein [Nitriliruptoraceae bacterium]
MTAASQRTATVPRAALRELLAEVETWEPPTVAVGVTDATSTLATHGPTDQVLWFASVTKPLTAYGVLLAAQHGELRLDEPVDVPFGPKGVTVRHLLAHAGGLPRERGGSMTAAERRRSYSDWAYELLGELVATRVGAPIDEHLDLEVFRPLGMTRTGLGGPAGHGVHGTLDDLLRFARELLAPTLLDPDLLAEATTVAFPGLDGVVPGFGRFTPNDWGLGFELKGDKGNGGGKGNGGSNGNATDHWMGTRLSDRTFGHFGLSGSFLWVDPERGVAAAELADREFGPWAREAWGPFNDRLVAVVAP